MAVRSKGRLADAARTGFPRRVLEVLAERPQQVLVGALAVFALTHLIRINFVPINGDGDNYLQNALRFANGELARSRYSPGWGFFLTPLAWLAHGEFWVMYFAGSLLNIALSILALVVAHRFLKRYLSAWTAVALVAVLALGQSATNVLIGVEVEPLALLSVTATLVALQEGRTWPAVAMTGIGVLSRVALTPFFVVLWLLRLRRQRRAALTSIALVLIGVGAYLTLQQRSGSGGYGATAANAYGVQQGRSGLIKGALNILPDHLFRYLRLGIPAIAWPSALLTPSLGRLLGLVTTGLAGVGVWQLLRRRRNAGLDDPGGVLVHAVIAGLAYFALLTLWPANNGAVVRLTFPMGPLVLLALGVGLRYVAKGMKFPSPVTALRLIALGAVTAAILATGALVVTRNRNSGASRAFLQVNDRASDHLPRGRVLSHYDAFTELITGHRARQYSDNPTPTKLLREADRARACAVVIDDVVVTEKTSTALREWAEQGGGTVIASEGRTFVLALKQKRCLKA
jgi:hypothetical protein